jgi:hypothetical protein
MAGITGNMADSLLSTVFHLLPEIQELEFVPSALFSEIFPDREGFAVSGSACSISHSMIPMLHSAASAIINRDSDSVSLDTASSLLVLLNGEVTKVWNTKRRIFVPERLQSDLHISNLVLKLHRKASNAWFYREFLMQKGGFHYQKEVDFIEEVAAAAGQHYYAWKYRLYLLRHHMSPEERRIDYDRCQSFCARHLSDSSAFHYFRIIAQTLEMQETAFRWVYDICRVYYSPGGLYGQQHPYGLEAVSLLRSALQPPGDQSNSVFYQEQVDLGRNPPVWLLKNSSKLG